MSPSIDLIRFAENLQLFDPLEGNQFEGHASDPSLWLQSKHHREAALLMIMLRVAPHITDAVQCKQAPGEFHDVTISLGRDCGTLGKRLSQPDNCSCPLLLYRLPRKHFYRVLPAWDIWQHRWDRLQRFTSIPIGSPEPSSFPDPYTLGLEASLRAGMSTRPILNPNGSPISTIHPSIRAAKRTRPESSSNTAKRLLKRSKPRPEAEFDVIVISSDEDE